MFVDLKLIGCCRTASSWLGVCCLVRFTRARPQEEHQNDLCRKHTLNSLNAVLQTVRSYGNQISM
jgi:hypothetical protein